MKRETEAQVPPFRTGDSVLHGPTGETWVVAYADPATGYMSWLGWPAGRALIADCTLVKRATDEAHQGWLRDLVGSGGFRAYRAVRLYGQPEPAHETAGRQALADREAQDHG